MSDMGDMIWKIYNIMYICIYIELYLSSIYYILLFLLHLLYILYSFIVLGPSYILLYRLRRRSFRTLGIRVCEHQHQSWRASDLACGAQRTISLTTWTMRQHGWHEWHVRYEWYGRHDMNNIYNIMYICIYGYLYIVYIYMYICVFISIFSYFFRIFYIFYIHL